MRSPRTSIQLAALLVAIPTLLAFPGCTATVEAPSASRLTIVQGHLQSGAVGTLLPTMLIMRAFGTNGKPIQGIPISFSVIAGGGTVDPATGTSDANGEVKSKWTLGPASSVQSVAATAPNVEAVILNALGILPSDMIIAQGNGQTAKPLAALSVPLVLRVTGTNNVPIPGQTVALAITSGGGSLSPQSAVTNALGEVSVRWTLGPTVGTQTATATAGAIGPVLITAIAQP
jgi:hypothetical protein